MTTSALKNDLHKIIDNINDASILKAVYTILSKKGKAKDWWDEISEEEKMSIEKGLVQANRGELKDYGEVRKSIRRKFNI